MARFSSIGGTPLLYGPREPYGANAVEISGGTIEADGSEGDFWVDTVNSRLYGPKTNGEWDTYINLPGVSGADGISFVYQGDWESGQGYVIGDWVKYNNTLYACNGNVVSNTLTPDVDAGWDVALSGVGGSGGGGLDIPYRSGATYWPAPNTSTTKTLSNMNGSAYILPIRLPAGETITNILWDCVAGATESTASFVVGIYSDSDGWPGDLLFSSTFNASSDPTFGVKNISLGATSVITTPLMWLAVRPLAGSAYGFRGQTIGDPVLIYATNNSANNGTSTGYFLSSGHPSGGLISTWTPFNAAVNYAAAIHPRLGVTLS